MNDKYLTFNDLPQAVLQIQDDIAAIKQIVMSLQVTNAPQKESTHVPMTSKEAMEYLKMPKGTFYLKLGEGAIPASKPGKCYVFYKDELDKWLEANRKNPVPMTADEMNASVMALSNRKPKHINP